MTRAGRRTLILGAVLVAAGILAAGMWLRPPGTVALTLQFHPFVGTEPMVRNEARYANPGGAGSFEVRDLQFLLSNVRLVGEEGDYAEPDSYHLARFDGAEGNYTVTLRNVPRRTYQRIEFGIGVDAAANHSLESRGDLDPNGRMAWTWETGYKFVLLEGALLLEGTRTPLVYHVGFDENYTRMSFEIDATLLDTRANNVDFRVDLLKMFTGHATVDMAALPSVKFERNDAALLARNYAEMINPM